MPFAQPLAQNSALGGVVIHNEDCETVQMDGFGQTGPRRQPFSFIMVRPGAGWLLSNPRSFPLDHIKFDVARAAIRKKGPAKAKSSRAAKSGAAPPVEGGT